MVSTAKAWVGAVSAALTAATVAAADHPNGLRWWDYVAIAGAAVAGFSGVYWAPRNKK